MIHENGYKFNRFTPIVLAMNLCDYVYNITDNANKFPETKETVKEGENGLIQTTVVMRLDALINMVRKQVFEIYMLAFTANEINLNHHPERKQDRLDRQRKAIELCNEHLATIQLCRKRFHLSYKRIRYWGGKTIEAREALERWHTSDKDRYKRI